MHQWGRRFGYDQSLVRYCHTGNSGFFICTVTDDDFLEQRLEKDGTLASIADACDSGSTEYCVSDLGIPGLRHFIYKSRSHVQITVPIFEDPYDNMEDRRR